MSSRIMRPYTRMKTTRRSVRALLSYRLAEFFPFDNGIKQKILEMDNTQARLELIKARLLNMEIEYEPLATDGQ